LGSDQKGEVKSNGKKCVTFLGGIPRNLRGRKGWGRGKQEGEKRETVKRKAPTSEKKRVNENFKPHTGYQRGGGKESSKAGLKKEVKGRFQTLLRKVNGSVGKSLGNGFGVGKGKKRKGKASPTETGRGRKHDQLLPRDR